MADQRLEIEVAVRDAFSSAMKEFGRYLDDANRKATELGTTGSAGMRRLYDETRRLSEHGQRANTSMVGLGTTITGIAKGLLSPVGLVAGFAAAGVAAVRWAESTALGQMKMKDFAVDTGFTAKEVRQLQAALALSGKTQEEQVRIIGSLGTAMQSLKGPAGYYAELYQTLQRGGPAGQKLGNELKALVDANKPLEAAILLMQQAGKQTPEAQRAISAAVKLLISDMQNLNKNLPEAIKIVTPETTAEQQKLLEEFYKGVETLQIRWHNQLEQLSINFLTGILNRYHNLNEELQKMGTEGGVTQPGESMFGAGVRKLREGMNPQVVEEQRRKAQEDADRLRGEQPFSLRNLFKRQSLITGDAGGDTITMSARARADISEKDLLDTEKDSNKLLRDIYSLMNQSNIATGGVYGGGGLTFRRGIGTGRGGGGGGTGTEGDTSLEGNEFLASQRARLKKELDEDPELRLRAAAVTSVENEGAKTGVMESAMNRAIYTGRSLKSILSSGPNSFYMPGRTGGIEARMALLRNNPQHLARLNALTDAALAGSNLIQGHTDQGSYGDPNYFTGGTGVNINRERFNDWAGGHGGIAGARAFREAQQAQVNASRGSPFTAAGKYRLEGEGGSSSGPSAEHGWMTREGRAALREQNESASRAIIGSMKQQQALNGQLNAEVVFRNVPENVDTRADGTGFNKFKLLKVKKGRGFAIAGEGELAPGDVDYSSHY